MQNNKTPLRNSDSQKEKARKEKINLDAKKDESILDKVRAKMVANFETLSEEEKADPANQLKGIPQEEIEAALAVRAGKLLSSFEIAVDEIPKIQNRLRELILECRDSNQKYHSPESFERAKKLAITVLDCRYLISMFGAFSKSLSSGNLLTIGTAIVGAGVLREKLENFIQGVSAEGINAQFLEKANEGMAEALDGVQNYQFSTEDEPM